MQNLTGNVSQLRLCRVRRAQSRCSGFGSERERLPRSQPEGELYAPDIDSISLLNQRLTSIQPGHS
jgi:hypothetical protein